MIKNQKQAAIARERLAELNKSLTELQAKQKNLSSAEYELGINSLNYIIEELQNDIHKYDLLLKGDINSLQAKELGDINKILIAARIAKKISQKNLAAMLDTQEQQIQRYEATDYESATWTRIQEIAFALGLKFEFKPTFLHQNKPNFRVPSGCNSEGIIKAKIALRQNKNLHFAE